MCLRIEYFLIYFTINYGLRVRLLSQILTSAGGTAITKWISTGSNPILRRSNLIIEERHCSSSCPAKREILRLSPRYDQLLREMRLLYHRPGYWRLFGIRNMDFRLSGRSLLGSNIKCSLLVKWSILWYYFFYSSTEKTGSACNEWQRY